jgi:Reverse transcriptase (RNA-dependent DNA polymerase)
MQRLGANPVNPNRGRRTRNKSYMVDINTGELVLSTESVTSDYNTPKKFNEAYNGPQKEIWRKSILKEIMNFVGRKSWKKTLRKDLKGRKALKTGYVFKWKDDPDISVAAKTRIVIKGYTEIPGVDYTEKFAPVATSTTVNMVMAMSLYRMDDPRDKWSVESIDVEAAFLQSDMPKDMVVYLEWPEGIEHYGIITPEERVNSVAQMMSPMYGKVDVPKMWKETLSNHFKKYGVQESKIDPCLYCMKDDDGKVELLAATTVDDILIAGTTRARQKIKDILKSRFVITELGPLKKHLGVYYTMKRDRLGEPYYEMRLPHMTKSIIEQYEKCDYGREHPLQEESVPATANTILPKSKEGELSMDQTMFRSLVGKIMYAVGKISPSLAYATNELATHMANPTTPHWKAMRKMVSFMNGRSYIDLLIMRKPKELRVVSGCDASHAAASEDRRSTMGEVHTLGGAYVNSGSRKVRCITLSLTESEVHAMSTAGQQVKFMNMLLDECMLHKSEKREPGWLYNDNIGGLFLANNKQVGMRTKHIDIRALFIRELQEEKVLRVFYEKSEYLLPDMMSKNLAQRAFHTHQSNLQQGTMIAWREDVGDDRSRRLGFVQDDNVSTFPQVGTAGVRASARSVPVVRDETWANTIDSNSNDDRTEYTYVYSNMIDRGQKAVGKEIRDARETERRNRQSYHMAEDACDADGEYSMEEHMIEYLTNEKGKS